MVREVTPIDPQALQNVTNKDLSFWFFQDTGAVRIVLTPDLIDTLTEYLIDVPALLFEGK